MNNAYYSELDKIIMKSRHQRTMKKYLETSKTICKFVLFTCLFYGAFAMFWSLLCYVFPSW